MYGAYMWNGKSYPDRSSWEKAKWADPVYGKMMRKKRRSKEIRKKIGEGSSRTWKNPETRKKRIAAATKTFRRLWSSSEHRRKMAEVYNSDEWKEKCSKKHKETWADPDFYEMMCETRRLQGKNLTEEQRKKNSEHVKELWQDPKYRHKIHLSKKSEAWKNGCKKISTTLKRKYASGEIKVWCEGLTKETDSRLATISKKNKGKIPDYGRYKYLYKKSTKQIWMRSTWEVAFAHWLDKQGTRWDYEPRTFPVGESKFWYGSTYTPDFYLHEKRMYIEIKGHQTKEGRKKLEAFRTRYPKVRIDVYEKFDLQCLLVIKSRGRNQAGVYVKKKNKRN